MTLAEIRAGARADDSTQDGGRAVAWNPADLELIPRLDVSKLELCIGRSIDVLIAGLALAVLLAPMAVICVAIKLTSRGPALFRQIRIGEGGKEFVVLKFRTMRTGTEVEVRSSPDELEAFRVNGFKLPSTDNRITRFGRLLRSTSLDELPQLVNVARGEMSLVGVRPLVPDEYAERSANDRALYRLRRPGITGLWQVEGRSNVGPADRLELDRSYVEQWSLRNDLAILCRTPIAVLRTAEAH